MKNFEEQNIFGLGNENSAYAQYFIGNSYLNPLTTPGSSAVFLANVTFEPGCRNNWHIHHANAICVLRFFGTADFDSDGLCCCDGAVRLCRILSYGCYAKIGKKESLLFSHLEPTKMKRLVEIVEVPLE